MPRSRGRCSRGQPGAQRDITLLNAAASLLIAGNAATIPEGLAVAADAIDSGRAAAVLDKLIRLSAVASSGGGSAVASSEGGSQEARNT